jgi:cellulose synthase/poly-beta-1,6-N-acetylglucosamine synthase-like glycosyltransferase
MQSKLVFDLGEQLPRPRTGTMEMSAQAQAKSNECISATESGHEGSVCAHAIVPDDERLASKETLTGGPTSTGDTGFVIVGRNEGERLRRCLVSVTRLGVPVVYVDGNSTDGSVELARSLGVDVLIEDPSQRNCTARARNAGFKRLCETNSGIQFVHFLDGDCQLVEGWLDQARRVLGGRPDVALVTGRRRECFPEQSVYNRLADIDWDLPVGEIDGSHGDILVRCEAFREVGGFNPNVLVSEDREMCLRLRGAGWILLRIDGEMTVHDMAMTSFREWWRRCIRTGYGFAQVALLHRATFEGQVFRYFFSTIFWGLGIPLLILGLAWPTRGLSLLLAFAYPLHAIRIALRHRAAGMARRDAWPFGWFCSLAHFPHAIGFLSFWIELCSGLRKKNRVITYK